MKKEGAAQIVQVLGVEGYMEFATWVDLYRADPGFWDEFFSAIRGMVPAYQEEGRVAAVAEMEQWLAKMKETVYAQD